MLKNLKKYLLALIILFSVGSTSLVQGKQKIKKLASQGWTFREYTLEETLVKLNELGISKIEMFPNQIISKGEDLKTSFKMDSSTLVKTKLLLKKHKIKAVSYGVVSPNKKADWVQLFAFAKSMKIKTIVSEPPFELLEFVDELAKKNKIKVAIHNHPDPTRYWSPSIVLEHLEGKSKYMGVCADIGHWTRSGLDASECLKQLDGKIFEIHLKDVTDVTTKGHAIVLGEGVIDFKSVIKELDRQRFRGNFVIEHEYNWTNNMPDLKKIVSFYQQL